MKRVRIADLKARLSEHIRYVRRGNGLTVLDRDTPVAQIVPIDAATGLVVRAPAPNAGPIGAVDLPPPLRLSVNPVAMLLEDRRAGR